MADFGAWERQDAVPRIHGARRASNKKDPFLFFKFRLYLHFPLLAGCGGVALYKGERVGKRDAV
jgi:hypothetical protein